MRCVLCDKEFQSGNRPDGLPNGMGFEMQDGVIYNFCTDCIIDIGKVEREIRDELEEDEEE